MARRTSKTKPRLVYVEPSRHDELPAGVAALQPRAQPGIKRDTQGRVADTESARILGERGGRTRAGKTALAAELGLAKTFADPTFERYRRAAQNFARLHVRQLAESVGGGHCGAAPASIVQSAALQLAASRWAFEVKGDAALGSKLANDSRQNLLAAHELCAREARPKGKNSLLAAIEAAGEGS